MPVTSKPKKPSQIAIVQAPPLTRILWLVHGFSTRQGGYSRAYGKGNLNLGFTAHDTKAAVARNRRAFIAAATKDSHARWQMATLRQVHSDLIHCVSHAPERPLAGDGLVTNTAGVLLAVLTADCLPVIVVDPKHRAVGVFMPVGAER